MLGTRDIAIYAAVIGTLDALWSLYQGMILDRARVVVRAIEGETITAGTNARQPILWVSVANRGRRPIYIAAIARTKSAVAGGSEMSADITTRQLPARNRLEEGQAHNFAHGDTGGYERGSWSTSRWYVVDGAGRTHPLRERYRQRLERIIFWLVRQILRRRRD